MSDLLAARLQMAVSLGFHIIFASISMVMPLFLAVSHFLWLRTGQGVYRHLAKAWSKGVGMFFAIGAVSGTALSFELGLLWPEFMVHAGHVIGLPFSWEGAAFFLEAVALSLYLYGGNRMAPWVHWGSSVVVALAGIASGAFVICANAWMNAPTGFRWTGTEAVDVDPVAAMFGPRALDMALHMTLAAVVSTGFAAAGLHALELLRSPGHPLHRPALRISLWVGALGAVLQPLSGDLTSKKTASTQPLKLAAAEGLFRGTACAPLNLGGMPDLESQRQRGGIDIPCLLSILAHGDPKARVAGLLDFPRELWPPVTWVRAAYQTMVSLGTLLFGLGVFSLWVLMKRQPLLDSKWFQRVLVGATPLGFICLEAGWIVTELGRQPWIIYGIQKTRDALTPMPGMAYSFALSACIYGLLGGLALLLLGKQMGHLRRVSAESLS